MMKVVNENFPQTGRIFFLDTPFVVGENRIGGSPPRGGCYLIILITVYGIPTYVRTVTTAAAAVPIRLECQYIL